MAARIVSRLTLGQRCSTSAMPKGPIMLPRAYSTNSVLEPRRAPLPFGPILEFAIGPPPYRKKVSEPWHHIMFLLMPTRGSSFQNFIVVLFGLLDNPLKADVSTNLVTMVITGEEGQQPGHPAVSVSKWVDAEEVHYKARCRQKRGDMQLVDGMATRQGIAPPSPLERGRVPAGRKRTTRRPSGKISMMSLGVVFHFPASPLVPP